MIPEAIAFPLISGVDPPVDLHASFNMAVSTTLMDGRPVLKLDSSSLVSLLTDLAPIKDRFIGEVMIPDDFDVSHGLLSVAGFPSSRWSHKQWAGTPSALRRLRTSTASQALQALAS